MRVVDIVRAGVRQRVMTFLEEEELRQLDGLPPQAVIGLVDEAGQLQVNSVFREFLHEIISRFAPLDPDMRDAARQTGDGRMVYVDSRVPESLTPVPEEDIIGWFQVRDGHIVEASYLANPNHRLNGTFGLSMAVSAMRTPMVRTLLARHTAG